MLDGEAGYCSPQRGRGSIMGRRIALQNPHPIFRVSQRSQDPSQWRILLP